MRSRAGPVAENLFFATKISVTRMKTFPCEHSSLGGQDKTFLKKLLRIHNIGAKMA